MSAPPRRLIEECRTHGPLGFERFMELALYDPEFGYYAQGPPRIGPEGDYFTASDAGNALGACLARQLVEIDRQWGPFDPFEIWEWGAGRGWLARDILDAFAGTSVGRRVRYTMVDRSEPMRRAAATRVPEARVLETMPPTAKIQGAVVAVELFDALPVHRVRRRDGELVEVYVDCTETDRLIETEGAVRPEVRAWVERYGAAPEEGDEAEVALGAEAVLRSWAGLLTRGVAIVIDYGDRAPRLYDRHPGGTLQAYRGHRVHAGLLEQVGGQDLTAHVNFTALEERATGLGFRTVGFSTQERFLIANGILGEFTGGRDLDSVRRSLRARPLIDPLAMGQRFKVLVLDKAGSRAPSAGA